MKYFFICVLSCLFFNSALACPNNDNAATSQDNLPCMETVNKDTYQIDLYEKEELLWSEHISRVKPRSDKKIGTVMFVVGLNIDDGRCSTLFVGSMSYGPMITTQFGGNVLSIPQEIYEGMCFSIKKSEEVKSSLLSLYHVVVKRM